LSQFEACKILLHQGKLRYLKRSAMPTALTQNWLVNIVLPIAALAIISFSAFAVRRHGWFSLRPVLSTYIWFIAITSALALVICFLQIPKALTYAACKVYLGVYYVTSILTSLFSVAVLYEFLFRMAGTNKKIQRTAVIGFLITLSGDLGAAYWLANRWPSNRLENVTGFLFETTALALLVSGLFIFAIKKSRSLFLERRLLVVLAAVTLQHFISLLSDIILRRSEQKRLVMGDVIWIAFSMLLYWALKNGPARSDAAATTVAFPAKT
jgi:hypothetical protein